MARKEAFHPDEHLSLYRDCLSEASRLGGALMEQLILDARKSLRQREQAFIDPVQLAAIRNATVLLNKHATLLCESFPALLRAEFGLETGAEKAEKARNSSLSFDSLELMDESQVEETVELARAQQMAVQAVESRLSELDALICAAQGLKTVRADRNPLRPEVYVRTLRAAVMQTQAPAVTRLHWMQHLGMGLGKELIQVYGKLIELLQGGGVVGASYAVMQSPVAGLRRAGGSAASADDAADDDAPPADFATTVIGPAGPASASAPEKILLTVAQLRRLLAGELDFAGAADLHPSPVDAAPAAIDTEKMSGYPSTVPAAFEALEEMRKVEDVIKRLAERNQGGKGALAGHAALSATTRGVGQALGQEVVNLMVENIASDSRLLPPVQEAVRALSPPLLKLALLDPRFFSDKQHPARQLLERMTQRSMAFETVDSPGFAEFIKPLQQSVQKLNKTDITGAEIFVEALRLLEEEWKLQQRHELEQREKAMRALMRAEQRNLLADKISLEIRGRADFNDIPAETARFVSGAWAQVMAQARIRHQGMSADPGGYAAVVDDLIWSAQPALSSRNRSRLIRLMPSLLAKLREGLKSIEYPPTQSQAFFNHLIAQHERGLKGDVEPVAPTDFAETQVAPSRKELEEKFRQSDIEGPWLAPGEVKHSGFMETALQFPEIVSNIPEQATRPPNSEPWPSVTDERVPMVNRFAVGSWFDFKTDGRWARVQLTWATPHGTLYMFSAARGNTHSMTRQMLDKLMADDMLRLVSDQAVVDGALDAVALAAMRNSVNTRS
jgi:hypothetical protein